MAHEMAKMLLIAAFVCHVSSMGAAQKQSVPNWIPSFLRPDLGKIMSQNAQQANGPPSGAQMPNQMKSNNPNGQPPSSNQVSPNNIGNPPVGAAGYFIPRPDAPMGQFGGPSQFNSQNGHQVAFPQSHQNGGPPNFHNGGSQMGNRFSQQSAWAPQLSQQRQGMPPYQQQRQEMPPFQQQRQEMPPFQQQRQGLPPFPQPGQPYIQGPGQSFSQQTPGHIFPQVPGQQTFQPQGQGHFHQHRPGQPQYQQYQPFPQRPVPFLQQGQRGPFQPPSFMPPTPFPGLPYGRPGQPQVQGPTYPGALPFQQPTPTAEPSQSQTTGSPQPQKQIMIKLDPSVLEMIGPMPAAELNQLVNEAVTHYLENVQRPTATPAP